MQEGKKSFETRIARLVEYLTIEGYRPKLKTLTENNYACLSFHYQDTRYLINCHGNANLYEVCAAYERISCSQLEELQAINKVHKICPTARIVLHDSKNGFNGYVVQTNARCETIDDFIKHFELLTIECFDAYRQFLRNLEN